MQLGTLCFPNVPLRFQQAEKCQRGQIGRAAPMLSALEVAFRQTRMPLSRQRLLVVQLLAQATDHPTLATLHARAREIEPTIGRSAVNRALAALVDAGLAHVIESSRGPYRYEDATLGTHGHLIDEKTGELINITAPELETAMSDIALHLGYRLATYRLRLTGRPLAEFSPGDTM